jgi:polysaccharide biosynthesis protein PslH
VKLDASATIPSVKPRYFASMKVNPPASSSVGQSGLSAAGLARAAGLDNRILLISSVGCPPPNEGVASRIATLIRQMRRLGYEVHFAGIRMTEQKIASTRPLVDTWVGNFENRPPPPASIAARLLRKSRKLLHRLEFVEDRLDGRFCDQWLDEARDLQRRCQYPRVLVAYVFHSKFLLAFPDPCLRILDALDVFSNRRQRMRAQGVDPYWLSFTPRDEKQGLLRAHRVMAIQNQEAAYFRRLIGSAAQVYTVGHLAEAINEPLPPAHFVRLGCIGSANASNVAGWQWFSGEVWPRIQARLPGVEVWLAGPLGEKRPAMPGVRLLGQVPLVSDFYRDCPVFINPVQSGTGLKIKTIEALMHGRPVVTTNIGAEGLDSFRGQGLYVADSAEEFADAVVALLSNLSHAMHVGEGAMRQTHAYLVENQRALVEVLSK